MNNLTTQKTQLPDTLEDLTQFVLVGKAKLNAYMVKLQAVNRLSVAQEIRDQTLKETQEISTALIAAEQRIGELLLAIPKATPNNNPFHEKTDDELLVKTKKEAVKEMGYSHRDALDYQQMAKNPEVVQKVIDNALANGEVVTKTQVIKEIKALKEELRKAKEEKSVTKEVVKTVVPDDYEDMKRKASMSWAYERDYKKIKELYNEMSDKWKQAEREKEKLLAKIEEPTAQNDARIKTDAYTLCAGISNFLERYGGQIYLMSEIDQLPQKERDAVTKAVNAIYRWANEMLDAGVTEVIG